MQPLPPFTPFQLQVAPLPTPSITMIIQPADIFGKKGCAFVSPVAGVVDEVNTVDKWSGKTNKGADRGGLSISIIGDDGNRYYGSTSYLKIETNIVAGAIGLHQGIS